MNAYVIVQTDQSKWYRHAAAGQNRAVVLKRVERWRGVQAGSCRNVFVCRRYMDTMVHMLKGSIGAGILAMPDAMSRLGLVYGILGLVLITAFATYCIHLLVRTASSAA